MRREERIMWDGLWHHGWRGNWHYMFQNSNVFSRRTRIEESRPPLISLKICYYSLLKNVSEEMWIFQKKLFQKILLKHLNVSEEFPPADIDHYEIHWVNLRDLNSETNWICPQNHINCHNRFLIYGIGSSILLELASIYYLPEYFNYAYWVIT
jgi:hypothetical protein